MTAVAYLEQLDRLGRVQTRQRLDARPLRIGRGYGCEWLLDDPHLAPHHATVVAGSDGTWSLRDAGSRNGMWVAGRRVDDVALHDDLVVQLGASRVRFRGAAFEVAPEAPHAGPEAPLREACGGPVGVAPRSSRPVASSWAQWAAVALLLGLAAVAPGLAPWVLDDGQDLGAQVLGSVAGGLPEFGLHVGAAIAVAMTARLLARPSRLRAQLAVAGLAVLAGDVLPWLLPLVSGVLGLPPWALPATLRSELLWAVAGLAHAAVFGRGSWRMGLLAGLAACAFGAAVLLPRTWAWHQSQGLWIMPGSPDDAVPAGWRLTAPEPIDDFGARVRAAVPPPDPRALP